MKKQIFVASVVYTFLSVLQPLSNFVLLPVYTKYFSESQYGTFSILNNLNILFSIIGGLGIIHAIIAFYSSYNDNKKELNKYVGNVLLFNFYFNVGLLVIVYLGGNAFFHLIFKQNIDFFPNGMLTAAYGLCSNIITGYLFFLKYEKNISRFALISIIQFVLSTVLQYVFIVQLGMSITGALSARLIVMLFCLLLVILYHHKYLFIRLDFTRFIKPSLKYSLNTIPSTVIGWLSSYGDRFLIERYIDLTSLGVYSFLSTISSLTEMAFLALGSALQPFIFDFFKAADKQKAHHLYRVFLLLSACFASFIILVGSNLNLLIHNKGYLEMVQYLPIMTIGYIFSSVIYLFSLQIIYARRAHYFIYQGVIILLTNLALNAILIPLYGVWGAVISSVATKLTGAISNLFFARKSFPISFEKKNYFILLLLICCIIGFWSLSYMQLLSYNISAVFQFLVICFIVIFLYRNYIIQTYREVLAVIKKK